MAILHSSIDSQGTNTPTEFRAGLFSGGDNIPDSPDPNSDEYQWEAARHVKCVHSGPTPFIVCTLDSVTNLLCTNILKSVSQSLLRVYRTACNLRSDPKIALINLHEANDKGKIGICNAVSPSDVRKFTNETYGDAEEYLIWGMTNAVVGTITLATLESLAEIYNYEDPFQVRI